MSSLEVLFWSVLALCANVSMGIGFLVAYYLSNPVQTIDMIGRLL